MNATGSLIGRKFFAPVAGALLSWTTDLAAAPQKAEVPKDGPPAVAIRAPRPEYPYEARRQKQTGSGIVVVTVDLPTGRVTNAQMGVSTGHAVLDNAALESFRQWRFKPGTVSKFRTPITFTMEGVGVRISYEVKAKNMDDVLAGFLGKGTVLKGPIPDYPRFPPWTFRSGKGVYELHAGKDGKVEQVGIIKSSGDAIFDQAAVKTLGKWRFRRGPLILELPLSFTLKPDSYSVAVSR